MTWEHCMASATRAIELKKMDAAEEWLWDALKAAEEFGPTSEQMIKSGDALAQLLMDQSKFKEAENLLVRLAEVKTQALGASSEETVKTIQQLANAYYAQAKYPQAESFSLSVLRSYMSMHGELHENTARVTTHLAYICHAQNKFPQAEEYYVKAINIKRRLGSKGRADLPDVTKLYCELLRATNRGGDADAIMAKLEREMKELSGG